LIDRAVPEAADGLRAVAYASVILVTLAFPPDALGRALDGTGFLVPEREGRLLTACSWASSKWAHLGGGSVILRASAGRRGDTRAFELDDDELVGQLTADLRDTMGVTGEPSAHRVNRWPDALPQFAPGHAERVAGWRRQIHDALPGLTIAGAGIGGLGIPACIRQAQQAATEAVRELAPAERDLADGRP
jgi:oxygen-dependent protoporphyrinogen oxidase